jgi:hypothetical protein
VQMSVQRDKTASLQSSNYFATLCASFIMENSILSFKVTHDIILYVEPEPLV